MNLFDKRKSIEDSVVKLLNTNASELISGSSRSVGDGVQEFLDWQCLTIGAIGWGQIQIANSNRVIIEAKNSRKKWMLQLCDALESFYPNEIAKIGERIAYFEKIRKFWEEQ